MGACAQRPFWTAASADLLAHAWCARGVTPLSPYLLLPPTVASDRVVSYFWGCGRLAPGQSHGPEALRRRLYAAEPPWTPQVLVHLRHAGLTTHHLPPRALQRPSTSAAEAPTWTLEPQSGSRHADTSPLSRRAVGPTRPPTQGTQGCLLEQALHASWQSRHDARRGRFSSRSNRSSLCACSSFTVRDEMGAP